MTFLVNTDICHPEFPQPFPQTTMLIYGICKKKKGNEKVNYVTHVIMVFLYHNTKYFSFCWETELVPSELLRIKYAHPFFTKSQSEKKSTLVVQEKGSLISPAKSAASRITVLMV